MAKFVKWLWVIALISLMGAASAGPEIFFLQNDPTEDDYGSGGYTYPKNIAFEPYKGLFDLQEFRVWREQEKVIFFDLKFAKLTNPWAAPEGFIHPIVHIYIDSRPGGQIVPATPGPDVRFPPEYAWDTCVIGAGWGNSRIITYDEADEQIIQPIPAEVIGGQTIRIQTPVTLLSVPDRHWRYYVVVGAYDGFGPGLFRDVRSKDGEWNFGGGSDSQGEPRVLDLLAPKGGGNTQERQLRYEAGNEPVVLTPVGYGFTTGFRWGKQLMYLLFGALAAGGLVWAWRSNRIFMFWHSKGKRE